MKLLCGGNECAIGGNDLASGRYELACNTISSDANK